MTDCELHEDFDSNPPTFQFTADELLLTACNSDAGWRHVINRIIWDKLRDPSTRPPNIHRIEVTNANMGDSGLQSLLYYLSQSFSRLASFGERPRLERLDLSHNAISGTTKLAHSLTSVLKKTRIHSLNMGDNPLSKDFRATFSEALQGGKLPSLRALNLDRTGLSIKDTAAIASYLASGTCKISELSISWNSISPRVFRKILKGIEAGRSVESLHIHHLPVSTPVFLPPLHDEYDTLLAGQLAANTALKFQISSLARYILRLSRQLFLSPLGDHETCPLRLLPTELKHLVLVLLVPMLSLHQISLVLNYASNPATLPDAHDALCLHHRRIVNTRPPKRLKPGGANCISTQGKKHGSLLRVRKAGEAPRTPYTPGRSRGLETSYTPIEVLESHRKRWLIIVDCDYYDRS